jgi:hypothetical protein
MIKILVGARQDFSKRHLKLRILTLFSGCFRPKITQKKMKPHFLLETTFLINSTRAIDWCLNYHIW